LIQENMGHSTSPPLLTADLAKRLVTAEKECMAAWLRAMEQEPGNPLGAVVQRFGGATALVCARIPAEVFNRVFDLTVEDGDLVPAILSFYQQRGAKPCFDVSPFGIEPFYVRSDVPAILARHGFYQGAFHQLLFGVPHRESPPLPPHIQIREVEEEDAAEFVQVYEQVWGGGLAIRVLIGQPQFRCYLAYVEGQPAALGVLHVANGVGSMANALTAPPYCSRGCQTALLHRRIHDAAVAGCDLLVSQCRPGSVSERNQLRAGFRIAGSKAWWVSFKAAEG
jgi:hypothetical protein